MGRSHSDKKSKKRGRGRSSSTRGRKVVNFDLAEEVETEPLDKDVGGWVKVEDEKEIEEIKALDAWDTKPRVGGSPRDLLDEANLETGQVDQVGSLRSQNSGGDGPLSLRPLLVDMQLQPRQEDSNEHQVLKRLASEMLRLLWQ